MDVNGRLHMPGFIGQTFEETGVRDTSPRGGNEPGEHRGNRKQRRAQEAMERRGRKAKAATAGDPA